MPHKVGTIGTLTFPEEENEAQRKAALLASGQARTWSQACLSAESVSAGGACSEGPRLHEWHCGGGILERARDRVGLEGDFRQ